MGEIINDGPAGEVFHDRTAEDLVQDAFKAYADAAQMFRKPGDDNPGMKPDDFVPGGIRYLDRSHRKLGEALEVDPNILD